MQRRLAQRCARIAVGLVFLVVPATAVAQSYNGLALTPPMGFNDWNAFACNVSEDLIKQTADAMVTNGMLAAGYNQVNIDDCWAQTVRDASGNIVPDFTKFPDGIKGVADYVHARGMKLGLYGDAGLATCAGYPGSLGYETRDAALFASWGVDYLKYDNCNNAGHGHGTGSGSIATNAFYQDAFRTRYVAMRDALLATGRAIVYSLCEWGQENQPQWGTGVGNLWRISGDAATTFSSMYTIFKGDVGLSQYAGPGHWNDPDMMEIGTGAFGTLAAPAKPGDTNVKVDNVASQAVGGALRIGTAAGGDLESAIVTSVGTAAGAATTLFSDAAAGDTNVKVGSTSGFAVGQPMLIDTGGAVESPTVTAIGTAGSATTLAAPVAAGDTNVKLASISNLAAGDTLTVDTGASRETATVDSVGTAAGGATSLVVPAASGDTNLKVASLSGFAAGAPIALDTGSGYETATVQSIGTAAGAATSLSVPSAPGATNLKVQSVSGFVAGAPLVIGTGASQEVATVQSVGTAAPNFTVLAASSAVGDTNVKVMSITGLVVGHPLLIENGDKLETATISAIGTAGTAGTGVTLAAPLTAAHASGVSARDAGTGITLAAPLTLAHSMSTSLRGAGTGLTLSAPLAKAHASGAGARATGTGVTLTAPLTGSHASGLAVRDESKSGTGITFSPALTSAHAINATARGAGTGITLATPLTKSHVAGAATGKSGMSVEEGNTHMSLWAMEAAPLIAGTDIVNIAKENLAAYLNRDLIAIDQDTLGKQAAIITNGNSTNHWVLQKPLANGDTAVSLTNGAATDWAAGDTTFATLGLDASKTYLTKDVWTKATTAVSDPLTVANVPTHVTKVLRLSTRAPQISVPASVAKRATAATGIAVDYPASGTDAFGGALTADCSQPSGSNFPIGPTTVSCTTTDLAGRSDSASFVVNVLPPEHPGDVTGTVPATLALTLGTPAAFGAFTPGVARDYTALMTANVISTAGDALLSVADPSATATGHLTNGAFSLPSALQAKASSGSGTGAAAANVGGSAAPTSLLTWSNPTSNDPVSLTFSQHVGASDALRTGTYSKTLTFTLSTTTP